MQNYVILVDKDDNVTGKEDKVKAHLGNGKTHRAITVLVYRERNGKKEFLAGKRADSKMLWPAVFDVSFATHTLENESFEECTYRRAPEEIGAEVTDVKYLFKFFYNTIWKDAKGKKIGAENEVCAVLLAKAKDEPKLNPDEISEIKWIPIEKLDYERKKHKDEYSPWFHIAFDRILKEKLI